MRLERALVSLQSCTRDLPQMPEPEGGQGQARWLLEAAPLPEKVTLKSHASEEGSTSSAVPCSRDDLVRQRPPEA